MALTYSPNPDSRLRFPSIKLQTVFGETYDAQIIPKDHCKVLAFICNHCPYVKAVEDRFVQLALEFKGRPVSFLAICANDWTEFPEDAPEHLAKRAKEKSYPFPYLVDADQALAKQVGAVCTPEFYVFGSNNSLFYRGRLDDSWKNPMLVKRRDLYDAINSCIDEKTLKWEVVPSMGCSIKWKE